MANEKSKAVKVKRHLDGLRRTANQSTRETRNSVVTINTDKYQHRILFLSSFYFKNSANLPASFVKGDKEFNERLRRDFELADSIVISDLVGKGAIKDVNPEELVDTLVEVLKDMPKEKVVLGFNSIGDQKYEKATGFSIGRILFGRLGLDSKWHNIEVNTDSKQSSNLVWPMIVLNTTCAETGGKTVTKTFAVTALDSNSRFCGTTQRAVRTALSGISADVKIGLNCNMAAHYANAEEMILLTGYKTKMNGSRNNSNNIISPNYMIESSAEKNILYDPNNEALALEPEFITTTKIYAPTQVKKYALRNDLNELMIENKATGQVLKEYIEKTTALNQKMANDKVVVINATEDKTADLGGKE